MFDEEENYFEMLNIDFTFCYFYVVVHKKVMINMSLLGHIQGIFNRLRSEITAKIGKGFKFAGKTAYSIRTLVRPQLLRCSCCQEKKTPSKPAEKIKYQIHNLDKRNKKFKSIFILQSIVFFIEIFPQTLFNSFLRECLVAICFQT